MGTTGTQPQPQPPTPKPPRQQPQEYVHISEPRAGIVGQPRLVRSTLTNIELQQYEVSNPESSIEHETNLYKLRSSSYSKSLVVVFNHRVLNENERVFVVRTEKMRGRLTDITTLTYLQSLCILEACFNGFAELVFHAKVPFLVTDQMIAINDKSQVRVWVNQNYALNRPMPVKVNHESAMVQQIFTLLSDRVMPEERGFLPELRFKLSQCQRVMDAKNLIAMHLQNVNKKAVLEDLVERQSRSNKAGINLKVPMNVYNGSAGRNSSSSASGQVEATAGERIQLMSEQYIKDDEGRERIRMGRSDPNFAPQPKSTLANGSGVALNPRRNIVEAGQNPNIRGSNVKLVSVGPMSVLAVESQLEGRDEPRGELVAASNLPSALSDRNAPKTTVIFPKNEKEKNKEPTELVSPRPLNVSPIKTRNQGPVELNNPSTAHLVSKIALSENKISVIEQKISKLKQQLNKKPKPNDGLFENKSFVVKPSTNPSMEEVRVARTPPHARTKKVEEYRPVQMFDGGQERAKVKQSILIDVEGTDRDRISSMRNDKIRTEVDLNRNRFNDGAEADRNEAIKRSEIFSQGRKIELRKSLAGGSGRLNTEPLERPSNLSPINQRSQPRHYNFNSFDQMRGNNTGPYYREVKPPSIVVHNFDSNIKPAHIYRPAPVNLQFNGGPFLNNLHSQRRVVDNRSYPAVPGYNM